MEIRVVGPWPFALLADLCHCVHVLAVDVLKLDVKAWGVVCPVCHTDALRLQDARALCEARTEEDTEADTEADTDTASTDTASTREKHTEEDAHCVFTRKFTCETCSTQAGQEEESEAAGDGDGPNVTFDVSGYGGWLLGCSSDSSEQGLATRWCRTMSGAIRRTRNDVEMLTTDPRIERKDLMAAWSSRDTRYHHRAATHAMAESTSSHTRRHTVHHATRIPSPRS